MFGNVRQTLARKRKELVEIEVDSMAGRGNNKLQALFDDIKKLMDLEECMWNQRSKVDWLKHGDLNKKYVHCRTTERNKRNLISGLENEYRDWIEDENQIGEILISCFSSLFTSANPNVLEPILEGVIPRVSRAMNEELLRPFVAEEVSLALKQMDADMAPSIDGLPPLFYKQFWDKVGGEVTEAVLSALNTSTIPKAINHTFLTPIPKIQSPRKVTDFWPISLSNVLYKLIAKVLANHLKPRLPQLISETQSAFMSERLITNNILVAHETLHHLKSKRFSKIGFMALKLDMRKPMTELNGNSLNRSCKKWVLLQNGSN